jgi:hypothetical protein
MPGSSMTGSAKQVEANASTATAMMILFMVLPPQVNCNAMLADNNKS